MQGFVVCLSLSLTPAALRALSRRTRVCLRERAGARKVPYGACATADQKERLDRYTDGGERVVVRRVHLRLVGVHLECSHQPHIQGRGAEERTQRAG